MVWLQTCSLTNIYIFNIVLYTINTYWSHIIESFWHMSSWCKKFANQSSLLDAYKNSAQGIKHLHYCCYVFRWLAYKTWEEFILKLLFYVCTLCFINIRKSGTRLSIHRISKVTATKVLTVFLIQGYFLPFIEFKWIVFHHIIKVKSQVDLKKESVLCLQVLLFLLIECEWINYLPCPPETNRNPPMTLWWFHWE